MTVIAPNDRVELNALIDGELPPARAAALEARFASEPDLIAAHDEIAATRGALKALPPVDVSPEFLERIGSIAGSAPAKNAAMPSRPASWFDGWQNIAAAVIVTAFLASGATYWLATPRSASLEELIAAGHHRSLLATTPVDVMSSDRHTVKPWLDAHLGVSPPAPDLSSQGYPLIGGRVDVLGQQAVPTLVYHHNEHSISLVAIPGGSGSRPAQALASGGYNMVEWSSSGFSFTAVSDLEASELGAFVGLYQAASGLTSP